MQIDGYSLNAQKTKMRAFCDYNEYEIASEYEDAGKSGKSIEGRIAFNAKVFTEAVINAFALKTGLIAYANSKAISLCA